MTLLLHGPGIVDAARRVYETARRPSTAPPPAAADSAVAQLETLRQELDTLAEREVQHASLLTNLARQVDVLRARLVLALAGAAVAVLLAVAAVVLALWR